jgi:hypothetical protein
MLLRAWLVDHGWQQCVSDPCIYIFRTGHVFAMIALYVDDIPAACNDLAWLASFKAQLGARFSMNTYPVRERRSPISLAYLESDHPTGFDEGAPPYINTEYAVPLR